MSYNTNPADFKKKEETHMTLGRPMTLQEAADYEMEYLKQEYDSSYESVARSFNKVFPLGLAVEKKPARTKPVTVEECRGKITLKILIEFFPETTVAQFEEICDLRSAEFKDNESADWIVESARAINTVLGLKESELVSVVDAESLKAKLLKTEWLKDRRVIVEDFVREMIDRSKERE